MDNFEFIKKFFENLKCSGCDSFFKEEAVQLIRQEDNNIVVRVTCTECGKALGLAILGTDRNEFKNSVEFEKTTDLPAFLESSIPAEDAITYEEVSEAHKFFSGLGSDWAKYLPKQE